MRPLYRFVSPFVGPVYKHPSLETRLLITLATFFADAKDVRRESDSNKEVCLPILTIVRRVISDVNSVRWNVLPSYTSSKDRLELKVRNACVQHRYS